MAVTRKYPAALPGLPSNSRPLLGAFNQACVTMLAAGATLACALAISTTPSAAVPAVVLCLSLARSHLERELHGHIEAALALPVVGLAAIGAGMLLHRFPWLGATAFVAAMAMSIWLRRFGATAARLGSLIGLPFIALLMTPRVASDAHGALPALAIPIIVGLLALFWVTVLHACARRIGVVLPVPAPRPAHKPPAESTLRPDAATRMAIQMACTLGLSFAIGFTLFAQRWSWIVLTAYIVASGNRGRLDVAYKSVLRVGGAAAGTLLSLVAARFAGAHDAATVALILLALFLGTWLRPFGYAWWALFVTIAFALLQGFAGSDAASMLWQRLEEIVIGAVIAIAAAWFVLPVSSRGALRRRLADALAAMADAFDPAQPQRSAERFLTSAASVEQMAPAFRAVRAVTGRWMKAQPADWIDALLACRKPGARLATLQQAPGEVRRAIGVARKALREPHHLTDALRALQGALEACEVQESAASADAQHGSRRSPG
jgi:hypothetical protein